MKALRYTLSFVLGIIIGILLFVIAIGGTVVLLGMHWTVGEIQESALNSDVISKDSEIYDKTLLEAVKTVIDDVQNFDTLSLKTLYEHYGISLLNGISGIDFTNKEFYSVPLPDLVKDLSILLNSFTLNDIGTIAGVDFSTYDLPVLTENLDNNVKGAIDNILGSLNGDMSIRSIKDKFGIDLGTADNDMLAALQDIKLSNFGGVIDVLPVSTLLSADTDTFMLIGDTRRFVRTDAYVKVTAAELKNADFVPALGTETFLAGGKDTDGDGKTDKADYKEVRYVKTIENADGVDVEKYVADMSCYKEDFNADENQTEFYRHIEFRPLANGETIPPEEQYIEGFANRINAFSGNNYSLVSKGFVALSALDPDFAVNGGIWTMGDGELTKDSRLHETETPASQSYTRVHMGSAKEVLQIVNHMNVSELRNADSLLDGLTVGDVVTIDDNTSKLIVSLKDSTLTSIGEDVNRLSIGQIIDVKSDEYTENANGKYVREIDGTAYIFFDKDNPEHQGLDRYNKNDDGTYTQNTNGKYVHPTYYTLYNPAVHSGLTRYDRTAVDGASSPLLQRFAGATLDSFSTAFDGLMLADVIQMDCDVYEETDDAYIAAHADEKFYYYDTENCVYRIANEQYRTDNPSANIYRISSKGESAAFIKKLAYVKIDGMSNALEIVVDDMIISEIIDIYMEHAVELDTAANTQYVENGKYFIEYDETNTLFCGEDEKLGKYVTVYDASGTDVESNFKPVEITATNSTTLDYKYVDFSAYTLANISDALAKIASGNAYYLDEGGNYVRNVPLCTYMLNTGITNPSKADYLTKIFYREVVTDGTGTHSGIINMPATTPTYGAYVRNGFLGYLAVDANNPAFCDMPIYTFEKVANASDHFLVNADDARFMSVVQALIDDGLDVNNIRYAKRSAETVYVKDDNGDYVFKNGEYVAYDPALHASEIRFTAKLGYIATTAETYYTIKGEAGNPDTRVTEFAPKSVITFIREKSSPVLRLLASGTIGEMNTIINDATVADVIEATPGSIFDNEEIKATPLSQLGNVFSNMFTKMTVGELLEWASINDVNTQVKEALKDVSAKDFFKSLTYDAASGTITVDMLKLYGVAA